MNDCLTSFCYGSQVWTPTLDAAGCVGVLKPVTRSVVEPKNIILEALASPKGTPSLASMVSSQQSVAILVSGKDRVTAASLYLPLLLEELHRGGVAPSNITVFMATGTHVPFEEKDRAVVLGASFPSVIPVIPHNCHDEDNMVTLGSSRNGNPIRVNRCAYEHDVRILTGRITHHYFAGFTAGRKSVLPGVASFETIKRNHELVLSGEGGRSRHHLADNGCLDGNPVNDEMMEAAKLFRPEFIFNTILDTDHDIVSVVAGSHEAHRLGCQQVDEMFTVTAARPAEAAVASCGGAPYDCSFMQSIKTLMNTHRCVSDDGVMLLLAQCPEGILPGFLAWPRNGSLEDLAERVHANYDLTGHNTYLLREILQRIRVVLVSSCPPEDVRALGFHYAASCDEGLELLYQLAGTSSPEYYLIPHGNVTNVRLEDQISDVG